MQLNDQPTIPDRSHTPEYRATIRWQLSGTDFVKGQYSREHTWTFDGGLTVAASPSPHVVPTPWSNPANLDPEEAFVAAIASCHMLTFLWLAAKAGHTIGRYTDDAFGVMTKNENRISWVSAVTLRPSIQWSGSKQPSPDEIQSLHQHAHEQCFIANSVKTQITIESAPA